MCIWDRRPLLIGSSITQSYQESTSAAVIQRTRLRRIQASSRKAIMEIVDQRVKDDATG